MRTFLGIIILPIPLLVSHSFGADRCYDHYNGSFVCSKTQYTLCMTSLESCKKDFADLAELCNSDMLPATATISTTAISGLIEDFKEVIANLNVNEFDREIASRRLNYLRRKWISSLFYHKQLTMTDEEFRDLLDGMIALEKMRDLRRQQEFKEAAERVGNK